VGGEQATHVARAPPTAPWGKTNCKIVGSREK